MKMHVISGGRLRMRKSVFVPAAERGETIELPVSAYLMRHAQGNVLFDSGCHPSVETDAEGRWGGLAKVMTPISQPGDNVVANLRCIGTEPDDIDLVICSHLHPDHCGCNAFFKKATVICHAKELEAAQAADGVAMGFLPADWDQPMPMQTIAGEHDVFGDGRIVLVPVPGHTPGTIAALVSLDRSGAFLLASDAVSLQSVLDDEIIPKNTWNADLARASLAEIKRIRARGATVICGHDDGQRAGLKQGADAYV